MARHMAAYERRAKVEARRAARSRRTATAAAADQDLFERMSYGRAVLAFPETYARQDTAGILAGGRAAAAEWRRRYPGRLPAPAKRWAKVAHGIAHELFAAAGGAP